MLKTLLLTISCSLILFSAGCNSSSVEINETNEPVNFYFTISMISENDLANLNRHISVGYNAVNNNMGLNLMFEFSHSVEDVVLIYVADNEEGGIKKTGVMHDLWYLGTDKFFTLTNYIPPFFPPHFGISFTDPFGEYRWYEITTNDSNQTITRQQFHWSHDYAIEIEDDTFWGQFPGISPCGKYHVVSTSETLFSIAQIYGVTVEFLQSLNNKGVSTDIRIGDILRVRDFLEIRYRATYVDDVDKVSNDVIRIDLNPETAQFQTYNILLHPLSNMHNLQIVGIENWYTGWGVSHIIQEIGNISPNDVLLFNRFKQGTLLQIGLVFTDDEGNLRVFSLAIADDTREIVLFELSIHSEAL